MQPLEKAIDISPNRAVARRLGVPYRTLSGLARELLREGELLLASPYRARRLLVQAVREVLSPRDPQGLAAAWRARCGLSSSP